MALPFPILTAEEAAELLKDGQKIGFSGSTPAGAAKAVPTALAQKAKREHDAGRPFKISVLTGASTGKSLDGALAEAEATLFRTPYMGNPNLRKQINAGDVHYVDMHLSVLPQTVRYGALGKIDWAVVEVCDILAGGGVVLTTSVGAAPTYLAHAEKIILELNSAHPATLLGLHDILEPQDPPFRREIPIYSASDRVGSPICVVDPKKIVAVVLNNQQDETGGFDPSTPETDRIGQNVADFLVGEMKAGRIPKSFLPLQSGVGNIANAVLAAIGKSKDIPTFQMYTEVLQDSVIPLIEAGRCSFASTTALTLSHEAMKKVIDDLDFYKRHILLRPQEISNNPEIVRRIGVVSMNTAIEFDLAGNVNSTHVMGKTMMNGIGGSGDFTRAAYVSIFSCPSTAKGGKIPTVVPFVSHLDHSEHSVSVVVTDQGVADLRGKDPLQRAELIINNCVHPDFKDQLRDYMGRIKKINHQPFSLSMAYGMHRQFEKTGDMRGINWADYC